jgi:hypothetical protein
MTRSRYYWFSIGSGIVWGLLALGISAVYRIDTPWAGIACAPLIGLLVGALSRPMHRRHTLLRVLFAVGTLYLATALFGLSEGLWKLVVGRPLDESTWMHLAAHARLFPGVITLIPALWFLFPLAVVNHWWLGFQYSAETRSRPAAV